MGLPPRDGARNDHIYIRAHPITRELWNKSHSSNIEATCKVAEKQAASAVFPNFPPTGGSASGGSYRVGYK